jgi:hypothetical protein
MTGPHHVRTSPAIRLALAHPWRVVGAWIVIVVAAIIVVGTLLGGSLNNEQATTNEPESMRGFELIDEHLEDRAGVDEVLIISSERHAANSPEFDAFLAPLVAQAPEVGVTVAVPPAAAGDDPAAAAPPVSEDGRAILVPLTYVVEDELAGD